MIDRRAFLQLILAAGGGAVAPAVLRAQEGMEQFYDLPPFGNVTLLHITDLLDQWKPLYYREPTAQLPADSLRNNPPDLSGDDLLQYYNLMIGSAQAYAFSSADYEASANDYGMLGGVAHLASLIRIVRKSRKHATLLDGGSGFEKPGTPWPSTEASDQIRSALKIDLALPDGAQAATVLSTENAKKQRSTGLQQGSGTTQSAAEPAESVPDGSTQLGLAQSKWIAQNIVREGTGQRLFAPYELLTTNGVTVAIIGHVAHNETGSEALNLQTNHSHHVASVARPAVRANVDTPAKPEVKLDLATLQEVIDEVRKNGAAAVVLLSRAGVDTDLKLAARLTGVDVILGGRSATPLPEPIPVANKKGKTLVTNAGTQGRFLGVLDMQIGKKGMVDFRYNLLPVVQSFLPADRNMSRLVKAAYASAKNDISEKLAVTDGLLYRRGTFNGSWDELLLDAMLEKTAADIAVFPGYRWGSVLLPGATITREDVVNQTAAGNTEMIVGPLKGRQILSLLEEAADGLFNRDPFLRSELDMLRTRGLMYRLAPDQPEGKRISKVLVANEPLIPDRTYQVASWGLQLPFLANDATHDSGTEEASQGRKREQEEGTEQTLADSAAVTADAAASTLHEQRGMHVQEIFASYLKQKERISVKSVFRPMLLIAEKS